MQLVTCTSDYSNIVFIFFLFLIAIFNITCSVQRCLTDLWLCDIVLLADLLCDVTQVVIGFALSYSISFFKNFKFSSFPYTEQQYFLLFPKIPFCNSPGQFHISWWSPWLELVVLSGPCSHLQVDPWPKMMLYMLHDIYSYNLHLIFLN